MTFELEFEDTFESPHLDLTRWVPYYLPHWSSRERSAARYALREGALHLLIDEDQEPWCPELDGDLRVSSLQTGVFAGPVGSPVGQHPFNPAAVVQEAQDNVRLYTPHYGRIELSAKAIDDPRSMVALWMIGYGDEPHRGGEICVCEIFGKDVSARTAAVGVGVHPFADPKLADDFSQETVEIDARDFHVYAAEWTPRGVGFFVDGNVIKTVDQSPDYPLQLMLSLYEFPASEYGESTTPYPKTFTIDYVRGYRLTD